ncbi:hypothetical protein CWATWH0402_124 [Crocosphaera watsonii WH 0402]|uniref:Uncharacterized protein n=1 Tax=Crocosphaera watsonii WH 0402 TaxID=1284629 RepID=T2JJZ6_CROWT|nr:hypothetical protein CWATWH0402_124 [Crocosphaera watsonii WH 0402]
MIIFSNFLRLNQFSIRQQNLLTLTSNSETFEGSSIKK